jgi:hypothetical protein
MDGHTGRPAQTNAYRRYVIGAAVATGVITGIGVGAFIAMTSWWSILFLAIPIGIRVGGAATGRVTLDHVAWVWPIVALAVAVPVAVVLPSSVAPFGLGLAVALWFALIVGAGILDILADPDGRQG